MHSIFGTRGLLSRHSRPEDPLVKLRHIILCSIGTDGDVFPYVGLGAALRRRGHRVTLVVAESYRALAELNGLDFYPLATRAENDELIGHPDFWHPLKGAWVGARWGSALLERHYELFAALARDGDAAFVASPAMLAARVAAEKLDLPLATLLLQPWMIQSCSAPPVMPAGLTLPRWAPRPVGNLYWRMIDAVGAALLGGRLSALRTRLGLPPVRNIFRWWLSPDLVLGMFPDWYGPPQPDWPAQVRLVGFPMHDGRDQPLPDDLLAFCRAGAPPVVFTFGTGMRRAGAVFRAALDACRRLDVPGIFLTAHAEQLPELPPTIRHVSFAPFSRLFPLCAAVVHHGGVGTIAKALNAGIPQLILPVAYDQKDNAIRVRRWAPGSGSGPAAGPPGASPPLCPDCKEPRPRSDAGTWPAASRTWTP